MLDRSLFPRSLAASTAVMTVAFCLAATTPADAQEHPIVILGETHEMAMESGARANNTPRESVVYSNVVHLEGAAWIRLYMDELQLDGASRIRYTSLFDGDVQEMDATEAAMWNYTSAYFNGDAVLVELIAAPGTTDNKLKLREVEVEMLDDGAALSFCGICFNSDDRVPTDEDFAGRIMNPGVCSATVYNEDSCIVTAGHCISGSNQVIQFRVPNSFGNGNIQNPPSVHQYPIINVTAIDEGVGGDWAVATTGLSQGQTIVQRYGEYRPLATSIPGSGTIQVWGFGASKTGFLNHTQQLSEGPIVGLSGNAIFHRADTTGGSSGSGILFNDQIIGVVTHCQTPCPNGSNIGTRIDLPVFADAIEDLCPVEPPPPPANNTCDDRILVGEGSTNFNSDDATTEGPDEPALCSFFGNTQIAKDVWFEHIATCTGELTVELCGSSFNTKLGVYAGGTCPTQPDTVDACDITSCPDNRSIVTIDAVEGQSYIIRAGGRTDQTGDGILTITCEEVSEPVCPGDLNDDGVVGGADLLILLGQWGACPGCEGDLNDDGVVDGADLLIMLGNWGTCP